MADRARSHLLSFTGLKALAGFAPAVVGAAAAEEGGTPAPDTPESLPEGDPPATPVPPAPPPPPPPADPEPEAAAGGPVALASDALRLAAEARADERARFGAVLKSPEGKANLQNAVFLLCHSDASAPEVIAQLKSAPAAGGSAITPRIPVGGGNGARTAGDEGTASDAPDAAAGFDPWLKLAEQNGTAQPAAAGAIGAAAASIVAPTLTAK